MGILRHTQCRQRAARRRQRASCSAKCYIGHDEGLSGDFSAAKSRYRQAAGLPPLEAAKYFSPRAYGIRIAIAMKYSRPPIKPLSRHSYAADIEPYTDDMGR